MKQIAAVLLLAACMMWGDAPLKTALDLSMDQARVVDEIEKKYQKPYVTKRHELNNHQRWMRAARIANDSKRVAEEEAIVRKSAEEFKQIQMDKDAEIRKVLNPEQNKKFDEYLKLRQTMHGSARDAKYFN